MTSSNAILIGLLAIAGTILFTSHSTPASAVAEGNYMISGGDGPGGAWRINTDNGAVSFCDARIETRGTEYTAKCTAWSD